MPKEFADFRYIPGNASVLLSVRPSAVLHSELLKQLPEKDFPLTKQLEMAEQQTGVDPRNIERATVAFWPGDGHVPFGPRPRGRKSIEEHFEDVPKLPKPEARQAPPGALKDDGTLQPIAFQDQPFPPGRPGELGGPGGPGGPGMMAPPKMDAVLIVQFKQPVDLKTLEAKVPGEKKDATHNGITYRVISVPDAPAYYMPNPTTLVAAHQDDMAEVLDNKTQAKVVQRALKNGLDHDLAVVAEVDSFRGLLSVPAAMADQQMNGQLKGLTQLPEQLEALFVFLDLKEGLDLKVLVDTNDVQATKTIKQAFDLGYGFAGVWVGGQMPQMTKQELGEDLGGKVSKLIQEIYTETKATAAGQQFQLSLHVPESAVGVIKDARAVAEVKAKEATKREQPQANRPRLHELPRCL